MIIKVTIPHQVQLKVAPRLKSMIFAREGEIHYIGGTEILPPPLNAEEEARAILGLESENGEQARATLIEHNLRLVVYIARKFENTGVGVEDLISIGTIGLIKAINTFNRNKNIKLATYASRCIENEILMYLRRNSKMRMEVSIDEPLNVDWDGNELLLSDILGTDADIIYRDLENEVERKLLKKALSKLSRREKTIIELRFGLNHPSGSKIDDDLYDELEEQLILADVGGDVAMKLVDALRDRVQEKGLKTGEQAADALRDIIADEMRPEAKMALDGHPAVILVIGVNGVGKTTSIAKLADYYTRQGKKVMLAAGDTFRAAASEQLEIWAGRAGVPIVKAGEGADPAAVIFDTVKSATARGYDMVIADTAGRLHNKSNLMSELSKISRSVRKAAPEASLETLLVLDAITGQNAISQAKEFCKAADATGIILTKLDGTAKGGCVVAVKQRLGLPVRFIGVGEGIDDLIPFTPEGFVEELIPRTGWKH